jgi:hypothetical protein
MGTYRNGLGGSTVPREISGLQIATQPRSQQQRAALATAIIRGETKLTKLTYGQVADICGVGTQRVYRERCASVGDYLRRLQSARTVIQLAAE